MFYRLIWHRIYYLKKMCNSGNSTEVNNRHPDNFLLYLLLIELFLSSKTNPTNKNFMTIIEICIEHESHGDTYSVIKIKQTHTKILFMKVCSSCNSAEVLIRLIVASTSSFVATLNILSHSSRRLNVVASKDKHYDVYLESSKIAFPESV